MRVQELSGFLAEDGTDMAVFCLLCGKRFQTQTALQQHMEVHAGVRSYICSECNRTFPSHTALKRHLRSHTGTAGCPAEGCIGLIWLGPAAQAQRMGLEPCSARHVLRHGTLASPESTDPSPSSVISGIVPRCTAESWPPVLSCCRDLGPVNVPTLSRPIWRVLKTDVAGGPLRAGLWAYG
ncbi:Zinc finger and BTB domain containing 16 isoform 3-like protein [Aix galericulata]|nr:Zinc finger and BTB domain containing 16 isoform 3-like protein [Aix galericulata]